MNNREVITKNYEVMNTVINDLLAECGKQNMYDESKNIIEARNIISDVYGKILMKYKNEQKQCKKCVKEFVSLEKIMKQKQEEKKKLNMIKKYIKTERLNIGGKELQVQYLVIEVDTKVVEVTELNEILVRVRTTFETIPKFDGIQHPNDLTNEELIYTLLCETECDNYLKSVRYLFTNCKP